MNRKSRSAPNTHLGEVDWSIDMFFGSMLPVCQGLLGMDGRQERQSFLDHTKTPIEDLRDYFEEVELEDGRLGLYLFADCDWNTCLLACIKTTLRFGDTVTNQMLLNLVEDFIAYVHSLPLADISKREGALWTDEDIERGYCEAANTLFAEAMEMLDPVFLELVQKYQPSDPIDDIPF